MPCFDEGDHHAVLAVGGADHIDGEVLGREGHGVVHRDHGGHIFAALFGFVEDVEFSAVAEAGVGDGHLGGLPIGRLPLIAVIIVKGDIVGGEHGVALLILAFHGRRVYARVRGHAPGDGKIHHVPIFCNAAALLLVDG